MDVLFLPFYLIHHHQCFLYHHHHHHHLPSLPPHHQPLLYYLHTGEHVHHHRDVHVPGLVGQEEPGGKCIQYFLTSQVFRIWSMQARSMEEEDPKKGIISSLQELRLGEIG